MEFSHSHSHLVKGDYCFGINVFSEYPSVEILKIGYDEVDKCWYVDNDEVDIRKYVFGERIEFPRELIIDGVKWKVNKVPYAATRGN